MASNASLDVLATGTLQRMNEDLYLAEDGRRVGMEYGVTPSGNPPDGRWVLRSIAGVFVDYDTYLSDLVERHNLAFLDGSTRLKMQVTQIGVDALAADLKRGGVVPSITKGNRPRLFNAVPSSTAGKGLPGLLPLPPRNTVPRGVFWRPNLEFITELAQWLQGKRVLEIFAGNGYLAAELTARGIEVQATSLLSGMDAHSLGVYHPVEPVNAEEAVRRYGDEANVLLVCWPTVTPQVLSAVTAWGADKDILYIGEVTDYAKAHLGGCATDEFFEGTFVVHEFSRYQGNMLEHAQVRRLSQ